MRRTSIGLGLAGAAAGFFVGQHAGEYMSEDALNRAADNSIQATSDYLDAERLLPDEEGANVVVGQSEVDIKDYERLLSEYEGDPSTDVIVIKDGRVQVIKTLNARTGQKGEAEALTGRDAIMADLKAELDEANYEAKKSIDDRNSRVFTFMGFGALGGALGGVIGGEVFGHWRGRGKNGGKAKKSKAQWDDGRGSGGQPSSF